MRTGLIAEKIGMSRIYNEKGVFIPVTILQVKDCKIVGHKTTQKDGYNALQVGFGKIKVKNAKKPLLGFFKKIALEPTKKIMEFHISEENFVDVGKELSVTHFVVDQFVDISGVNIGKGFAGVIKRHNFRSLRATHGVSLTHRSHGSTGNRQDPGRVFKGKKMAGHMGNVKVTTQNAKIIAVDESKQLIIVKGSLPGHKGTLLSICDAVKKQLPKDIPLPAAIKQ